MKKLLLVSMAVMALGLTACGNKGAPHAPGRSQPVTYPGTNPP
ncbi:MAG: lipoprotein [Gluconobacter oxydans]